MTLNVHSQNKMADGMVQLFDFGEDFEAVLEGDEVFEEEFGAAVSNVSIIYLWKWLLFCFSELKSSE